ncbi:hypothetical protein ILYODFUR_029508 [Ilyodon furcidens]|uniref:Uncharacterized protein n=1 Tax=Ilyodon furcidens TaxID=33524 RepID=A0ABV0SSF3_9TELE
MRSTTDRWSIQGEVVERVDSIKFLDIHIFSDLSWTENSSTLNKTGTSCKYRRSRQSPSSQKPKSSPSCSQKSHPHPMSAVSTCSVLLLLHFGQYFYAIL